ncbi:DNA-directed RNA polymerase subunit delta [Actinomycetes bacterium NPDC127524]
MLVLSLKNFTKEQIKEMSLIEMTYELLVEKNGPLSFSDIMAELTALQGMSKAEKERRISQFYTDLNVDGRFTSLGDYRWGLKTWYPFDQIEEEVVHTAKPKKKKGKKAAVADDDFDELEDEDLDFEEDVDDLEEDEDDLLDDGLDEDDDDDLLEDDDEDEEDLDEDIIEDEEFDIDEDDEEDEDEEEDLDDDEEKEK